MIVFDASTLIGAAIKRASIPDQAMRRAFEADDVAILEATPAELTDVLARVRLERFIDPELRDEVFSLLDAYGAFFCESLVFTWRR